jgi:hypothetical protein
VSEFNREALLIRRPWPARGLLRYEKINKSFDKSDCCLVGIAIYLRVDLFGLWRTGFISLLRRRAEGIQEVTKFTAV